MPARTEINMGDVFGKVTVVSEVQKSERIYEGGKRREFILKCDCGNLMQRPLKDFLSGRHVSCGCHGRDARLAASTSHGQSGTRQYRIWAHMVWRCTNPRSAHYAQYGGRGIKFDKKWATFGGFWLDMGATYEAGLELDRIDPNGDYTKSNCRWVNESVQAYNQRLRVTNSSGRTGVYKARAKDSWWAEIQEGGRTKFLGTFHSFEEACAARVEAEQEIYGFTKEDM